MKFVFSGCFEIFCVFFRGVKSEKVCSDALRGVCVCLVRSEKKMWKNFGKNYVYDILLFFRNETRAHYFGLFIYLRSNVSKKTQ